MPEQLQPLYVEICEAKPNPLFTEEQRSWIRFLRFSRRVACAECGKKVKVPWTMLCEFRAINFPTGKHIYALDDSGKVHPPLTPVCGDHPLAIAWPEEEPQPTEEPPCETLDSTTATSRRKKNATRAPSLPT